MDGSIARGLESQDDLFSFGPQDFQPPIHLTDSDFAVITQVMIFFAEDDQEVPVISMMFSDEFFSCIQSRIAMSVICYNSYEILFNYEQW
jgi:hypothetical protein